MESYSLHMINTKITSSLLGPLYQAVISINKTIKYFFFRIRLLPIFFLCLIIYNFRKQDWRFSIENEVFYHVFNKQWLIFFFIPEKKQNNPR